MSDLNDFIDGQKACREGKDCPAEASEAFVRGYSYEYTSEQVMTHRSEHEHHGTA